MILCGDKEAFVVYLHYVFVRKAPDYTGFGLKAGPRMVFLFCTFGALVIFDTYVLFRAL